MQESQLYVLWQALGRSKQWVQDGRHRLRVLEAGTLNLSFGPDFSGARFDLDGTRYYGDVEMHVEQSDWYRHRHHLNPFYRNVALHVVLIPPEEPALVHSEITERTIPSFCLHDPALTKAGGRPASHCHPATTIPAKARLVLQELALKRLRAKIRALQEQLLEASFSQVFYESFMRTLGYPHNSTAFLLLARGLPFAYISEHLFRPLMSFETLYAVYAGLAGFLAGNSDDPYIQGLQTVFNDFRSLLPTDSLPGEQWHFSATRPSNHPHFRLAAWVAFLRKTEGRPFAALYALFARRSPYRQLLHDLRELFSLPVHGYWAHHYRLGAAPVQKGGRYFLGTARLFELITNTFIPLLAAQALQRHSMGFFEYLQHFYLFLPAVTDYHSLARHLPWWKAYRRLWPQHALWQALLQLETEYCRSGACAHCPLRHRLDKTKLFN